MKKHSSTRLLWGIGLLALLPLLLFMQKRQTVPLDASHKMTVKYKEGLVNKHRIYKVQLFFEGHEDNFILDNVTYKAWRKRLFIKKIKKGDFVEIMIPQKKMPLLNNGKEDRIKLLGVKEVGTDTYFITPEDYNLYRQLDFVKFYVFWGIAFMIYIIAFFRRK